MEEHAPLVRDTHDNGYGLMGVAKEHFIRDTIVCMAIGYGCGLNTHWNCPL